MKNQYLLLLLCSFFVLCSCNRNKQDASDKIPESEIPTSYENIESTTKKSVVLPKKIDIAYDVIKGQELIDNEEVKLDIQCHYQTTYVFELRLNRKGKAYPEVFDQTFKSDKKVEANKFSLSLKGSTPTQKNILNKSVKNHFGKTVIELMPSDLRHLKAGQHTLDLTLNGHFESFHGTPSKEQTFEIQLQVPVEIFPIYKTEFHFSSLKLNRQETMAKLGNNDFKNSTPDVKMQVFYFKELLMTQYSKNSFDIHAPKKATVYHTKQKDEIDISIVDKDFFLNPNDRIADTTISIENLEANTYQNLDLYRTDELKVYAKGFGRVN